MHNIINRFLFLSAVALTVATGFPPVVWSEPKFKPKREHEFSGKLKKKYN